MSVIDRDGITYEFIASVQADGRRSLTRDWRPFALTKGLRTGELLRIYHSGNENENIFAVQLCLELHGGQYIVWETLPAKIGFGEEEEVGTDGTSQAVRVIQFQLNIGIWCGTAHRIGWMAVRHHR
ncbi:unnamed protein product [Ilex paraguariensis]|uniref:TF-B3 domain-containing protein n=1 Tax=Ilex paraguariensis TaxID=185542 RepID=A0ABC8SCL3_9AQUA